MERKKYATGKNTLCTGGQAVSRGEHSSAAQNEYGAKESCFELKLVDEMSRYTYLRS